jgi:hypothetical protein
MLSRAQVHETFLEMHYGKAITQRQCEHTEYKNPGCPRNHIKRQAANCFNGSRSPDYWSGSLSELASGSWARSRAAHTHGCSLRANVRIRALRNVRKQRQGWGQATIAGLAGMSARKPHPL